MASMASDSKRFDLNHDSSVICEITEYNQSGNEVATYLNTKNENGEGFRVDVVNPIPTHSSTKTHAKRILNAFMPAGYPSSVSSDYLEYQIYDSLQAFSSSIAGLLASRAVLEGIGVGDTSASPTAALLLSILQDSMGRIATILFAHRLGTSLEPECKMYRFAADIFNDTAMVLDCMSPVFPKAIRVGILSLSSILRALCGVAAGSSKASLSAHFALNRNLGELNAKDSSQETIISLMGMLTGSFVVSRISSQFATWVAMIILLSIHLGTNYLAVRAVNMRTLNRQRANIVLSNYLAMCERNRTDSDISQEKQVSKQTGLFLTPEQVSPKERIFEWDSVLRWSNDKILGRCRIGIDINTILASIQRHDAASGSYSNIQVSLSDLLSITKSEYIIWLDVKLRIFLVALLKQTSDQREPRVKLEAWLHALSAARMLDREGLDVKRMGPEKVCEILRQTRTESQEIDGVFQGLSDAGWDLSCDALETRAGARIEVKRAKELDFAFAVDRYSDLES